MVNLNEYSDFFAKIASVYTGIIGVIVGYYFGKRDNAPLSGDARHNLAEGKNGAELKS